MYSESEPEGTPWRYRISLTPRKTYSGIGKIVYERKKHYFSQKDVDRILSNYTARPIEKDDEVIALQGILQRATIFMLEQILARFGLEDFARRIYYFLITILDTVFGYISAPEAAEKIREGLREMIVEDNKNRRQ
jgi:hypothetical protein